MRYRKEGEQGMWGVPVIGIFVAVVSVGEMPRGAKEEWPFSKWNKSKGRRVFRGDRAIKGKMKCGREAARSIIQYY